MPRLEDMATQAVKFLQTKSEADDTGYFIMIEAGRIDQAHHNGHATTALSETVAFDKAIDAVMKLLNRTDDTLGNSYFYYVTLYTFNSVLNHKDL